VPSRWCGLPTGMRTRRPPHRGPSWGDADDRCARFEPVRPVQPARPLRWTSASHPLNTAQDFGGQGPRQACRAVELEQLEQRLSLGREPCPRWPGTFRTPPGPLGTVPVPLGRQHAAQLAGTELFSIRGRDATNGNKVDGPISRVHVSGPIARAAARTAAPTPWPASTVEPGR